MPSPDGGSSTPAIRVPPQCRAEEGIDHRGGHLNRWHLRLDPCPRRMHQTGVIACPGGSPQRTRRPDAVILGTQSPSWPTYQSAIAGPRSDTRSAPASMNGPNGIADLCAPPRGTQSSRPPRTRPAGTPGPTAPIPATTGHPRGPASLTSPMPIPAGRPAPAGGRRRRAPARRASTGRSPPPPRRPRDEQKTATNSDTTGGVRRRRRHVVSQVDEGQGNADGRWWLQAEAEGAGHQQEKGSGLRAGYRALMGRPAVAAPPRSITQDSAGCCRARGTICASHVGQCDGGKRYVPGRRARSPR